MAELTAPDYIASQLTLQREAQALMPHDPSTCTYSMGPLRQEVYACMTCSKDSGKDNGVCYSCSIQCHADHELVELFTKRNFACDCGTERTNSRCNLRKSSGDIGDLGNQYGQNYRGKFCGCGRNYDPNAETGNMLQCLVCEDWWHDYCIMGLPKFKIEEPPKPKEDDLKKQTKEDEIQEEVKQETGYDSKEQDEVNIDGFPNLDDFDTFICYECTTAHSKFFDLIRSNDTIVAESLLRIPSSTLSERNSVLQALQSTTATLSKPNSFKRQKTEQSTEQHYKYSLFLHPNYEANFNNLLISNPHLTPNHETIKEFLSEFPFLTKDDIIYTPPIDEDPGVETDEEVDSQTARMVDMLPREQAVVGVEAYLNIRDKLKEFLRPFAEGGKVVEKGDVLGFFEELGAKDKKKK